MVGTNRKEASMVATELRAIETGEDLVVTNDQLQAALNLLESLFADAKEASCFIEAKPKQRIHDKSYYVTRQARLDFQIVGAIAMLKALGVPQAVYQMVVASGMDEGDARFRHHLARL